MMKLWKFKILLVLVMMLEDHVCYVIVLLLLGFDVVIILLLLLLLRFMRGCRGVELSWVELSDCIIMRVILGYILIICSQSTKHIY